MELAGPVATAHLYLPLHLELIALLRGLAPDDWMRPTVCSQWAAGDIAAHLLDVDLRRLSLLRDGVALAPPFAIDSAGELTRYLNLLNGEWVTAARRISPALIVDFLEVTGPKVARHVASLDPDAPSRFPVAWAGDSISPNWFDIGRDYTERWHHQQQIRDAVRKPGLTTRKWLFPFLSLFMRAVAHAYRLRMSPGNVCVIITGEAGGTWSIANRGAGPRLCVGAAPEAACRITADQDTAWRMFTKGLNKEEARSRIRVEGPLELAEPFTGCLAVMA